MRAPSPRLLHHWPDVVAASLCRGAPLVKARRHSAVATAYKHVIAAMPPYYEKSYLLPTGLPPYSQASPHYLGF